MYRLYGALDSGSAAIEAALLHAGLDFEWIDAAPWAQPPVPGFDELRRINPLAQIPTLILPGGAILTESAAILIHLGLAHPQSHLLPDDHDARAQVIRGLVFIAANCYPMITVIDYPERIAPGFDHARLAQLQQGATARLHAGWDMFAATFKQGPYLSGTRVGALDLLAATVSRWDGARAHLARSHPSLVALLQRIDRMPPFAQVFGRHWPDQTTAT